MSLKTPGKFRTFNFEGWASLTCCYPNPDIPTPAKSDQVQQEKCQSLDQHYLYACLLVQRPLEQSLTERLIVQSPVKPETWTSGRRLSSRTRSDVINPWTIPTPRKTDRAHPEVWMLQVNSSTLPHLPVMSGNFQGWFQPGDMRAESL